MHHYMLYLCITVYSLHKRIGVLLGNIRFIFSFGLSYLSFSRVAPLLFFFFLKSLKPNLYTGRKKTLKEWQIWKRTLLIAWLETAYRNCSVRWRLYLKLGYAELRYSSGWKLTWKGVQLSLSYGRRSVDEFILVSGSHDQILSLSFKKNKKNETPLFATVFVVLSFL
jgi:hypothetical protein